MNSFALPHQEIEATLAICSEEPEAVAARVAGLTELAGCRLDPKGTLVIRDRYFDSPEFALARAGWGFRLRECNGELFVALKGPAERTDWGGLVRSEREGPWNRETLERMYCVWADLGLIAGSHAASTDDPLRTMANLGLKVIQDRFTRREVRDVLPFAGTDARLAELVVDAVTYEFPDLAVRHLEVEIEAKSDGSSELLGAMVKELLTLFGDSLRIWEHNKLATGLALGYLRDKGDLTGLLGKAHTLRPHAYDRLAELFASGWSAQDGS